MRSGRRVNDGTMGNLNPTTVSFFSWRTISAAAGQEGQDDCKPALRG
jgi:hypothetical protein